MDSKLEGIEATAVEVEPPWKPSPESDSIARLPILPAKFSEKAAPYKQAILEELKRKKEPDNPKLWLQGFRSPLTDRPVLSLEVGRTNYSNYLALQTAFDKGNLRAAYETGELNLVEDVPGLLASVAVIITSDNHLILAQRSAREVIAAGGKYSATFEEQWNPQLESDPNSTVLRGLSEEFNLDKRHDVYVSVDNLRLVALAREWGAFWNTVLIYVVILPAKAQKVLQCWKSVLSPKDKNEHVAVAAVPMKSQKGRNFLLDLLDRQRKVSVTDLKAVCGEKNIVGYPTDQDLHPATGRARILIGMISSGNLVLSTSQRVSRRVRSEGLRSGT